MLSDADADAIRRDLLRSTLMFSLTGAKDFSRYLRWPTSREEGGTTPAYPEAVNSLVEELSGSLPPGGVAAHNDSILNSALESVKSMYTNLMTEGAKKFSRGLREACGDAYARGAMLNNNGLRGCQSTLSNATQLVSLWKNIHSVRTALKGESTKGAAEWWSKAVSSARTAEDLAQRVSNVETACQLTLHLNEVIAGLHAPPEVHAPQDLMDL